MPLVQHSVELGRVTRGVSAKKLGGGKAWHGFGAKKGRIPVRKKRVRGVDVEMSPEGEMRGNQE